MDFAARLTRHPIAFDTAAGQEAWAALGGLDPQLAPLITGTAGCSPYLKGLMAREADWLRPALGQSPEAVLEETLAALDPVALPELPRALRMAKRRLALLAALADLGGVWPLEQVTDALTRLADRAVHLTLCALVAEEIRRGKIPGARPEDAATAAGMVAFAMGKMGAGELNYSSDIDLICLFDESRYAAGDQMEARAAFIRVTRRLTAILGDFTDEGYVFRTDLRLRPDASVMPVCLSMEAAERYYETFGRTWERAAWIKARPCGGDIAAGTRFQEVLRPFVWRRHLDFVAIQDAHDMRLRIRAHKGLHGPGDGAAIPVEGHNIKLGAGGIREIEFFTQTRQLIAGGRDPDLRDRTTEGGLAALAAKGWIPAAVAEALRGHYRAHREIEHRLQMVNDAQTQIMPNNAEGIDRIARFMGTGDTGAFRAKLSGRLSEVAALTEGFFAPGEPAPEAPAMSEAAEAIVARWNTYPALRSGRAREVFRRLRPEILTRMQKAGAPEEALAQFDGFLAGLPAGVQLFALFEANPQLIDLIVDICATAPRLAQYLSRNAGVLDAVLAGAFFAPWPGEAGLLRGLADRLDDVPDYERKLDAARAWAKEWHFRIGVHHLRGLADSFEAAAQYADLARAAVAGLWGPVCAEFARRHGPAPGRGAVVLGMGSLGAGRLNAVSDLDLILIYDAQGAEASQGPRPLTTTSYFARLTKALITALSAPMAEGRLYEVDMRLRPSGRQGPVATALSAFDKYQRTEAWTWEHLALTRARVIAGDAALGAEVEALRRAILTEKGTGAGVLQGTAEMWERTAAARPGAGRWDVKAGRGRLQEIELVAQAAGLRAASPARGVEAQLAAGVRAGWPDKDAAEALLAAYRLCWRVHCAGRLLADGVLAPEGLGAGACGFVLREAGAARMSELADRLDAVTAAASTVTSALLAPGAEDAGTASRAAGAVGAPGAPSPGEAR